MKIRLAYVIPTMDQGGAEKQLALLAENLPASEFDVHVCLLTRDGPRSASLREAGIPVTVVGKRFKVDPTALVRLKKLITEIGPDVVHTWLFAANSFGRMAARLAGVPTIIASERCVDPWKSSLHFAIDRYLAKRTAAITTNSEGVVDFYAGHGIPRTLFHVIPNGIVTRKATSISRDEAFRRFGVDPSRKVVLAVGRLWPQKRYRDLIWAGELLAASRGDVTMVVIGDGPQKDELLRFRDLVTTPNHVAFLGPRQDVAELLPHADLFWIGSEYEGQSNALIEAMQAGVAVVASDIPGNRDLVLDGKTGRLVRLGDRAQFAREANDLLDHPEVARKLAESAKQRILDDFNVEQMVNRHAELYRQLAGASRNPGVEEVPSVQ